MKDHRIARRMWSLFEPIHAVTYFAPRCIAELKSAGLKGFWMGYFAGRSAPMGPVGPAMVEATFYNFAPVMVRRAIPDAWRFSTVDKVLDARLAGVEKTLGEMLGERAGSTEIDTLCDHLRSATGDLFFEARPLGAANADLPWPTEPVLVLWQAATILREHRGDGHNLALLAAGLDGCQAHVSLASVGSVSRSVLQPNRGWTDEEWESAEASLRERDLIDSEGLATDAGLAVRRRLEGLTDQLAMAPWVRLGEPAVEETIALLEPLSALVAASGVIPPMNPMGLAAQR